MSTDWEQHYQDGHMPWDKGSASPPLIDWVSKNPGLLVGEVLVPGCGLGHDVRAINGLESNASVLGIDISAKAIEMAEGIVSVEQEKYLEADLFTMSELYTYRFDCVWEHTCFCAIDPAKRDDYVDAVFGLLKPEGMLLAIFYLNPYDDEHQPGGRPPHGCSIEEIRQRFTEAGNFRIVEEYTPKVSYPGREGLEYLVQFSKAK